MHISLRLRPRTTTVFLLHSVGQSKSQGQPSFKSWGNIYHFLMEKALKSHSKGSMDPGKGKKNCCHFFANYPTHREYTIFKEVSLW